VSELPAASEGSFERTLEDPKAGIARCRMVPPLCVGWAGLPGKMQRDDGGEELRLPVSHLPPMHPLTGDLGRRYPARLRSWWNGIPNRTSSRIIARSTESPEAARTTDEIEFLDSPKSSASGPWGSLDHQGVVRSSDPLAARKPNPAACKRSENTIK
jgi:hypothetical protein